MADSPTDSAAAGEGSADQPSSSVGEDKHVSYLSDRILGVVCLLLGVWYVFETRNFVETAFGSGPVGPKTLPILVGIFFSIMALVLIVRPDESPDWPSLGIWWQIAAVVATSFLYGQLLDVGGFIIASTLLSVIVGLFFRGPILKLLVLSFVFSIAVAYVFNNWLQLHLPDGWWGGF
jgi:putative tricarboxylic transport membrane protein